MTKTRILVYILSEFVYVAMCSDLPSKKAFVSSLILVHSLYSANRLRYLILLSLVTSIFWPLGIRGIIYKKTGCIKNVLYTLSPLVQL